MTVPAGESRLTPRLAPDLPEPYDAYLWVAFDAAGQLLVSTAVRPGYDEVAFGLIGDWMFGRIKRLLNPDGSEPDEWGIGADGHRYAFHEPDSGPDWIDGLLDFP